MLHFRVRLRFTCKDEQAYGDTGRPHFATIMEALLEEFSSPVITMDATKKEIMIGAGVQTHDRYDSPGVLFRFLRDKGFINSPYNLVIFDALAEQYEPIVA